jgi:NDP-sugar pyrophosphorylase family protein
MLAKQAIILLGGKGMSLSGLFPDIPKPLAPVAGRPFLAWQLDWLDSISSVLLAAGYLGDKIRAWVQQSSFKDRVTVSIEPAPRGTGGALKYLEKNIACGSFWALNGDSLLPQLNFKAMAESHRKSGALGTIAVTTTADSGRYGAVLFDNKGKITKFNEKRNMGAGWVNAGVYLLEPALLSSIKADKMVSLEHEIFPVLAAAGKLFVFQAAPPLLDMGTPEGLKNTETYLRHGK